MPISYRLKDGQHAHDLAMYKKADTPGTEPARRRLAALFWDFCRRHIACVKSAAEIASFTHVCFVPSTRSPHGEHPLQRMLAPAIPLPRVPLHVNPDVSPERRFDASWFEAHPEDLAGVPAADVLLIDDTWVTGSRMQSAAHSLKRAGARRVASLVLARQLSPGFAPARQLIAEVQQTRFDPDTCVVHHRSR
ncbi:phosphoribosyltransferase [Lipingzhangella sp. LS1_29]|uniref:Phosphoribosyltransferase n=1 Tax=Lipingzhangella rawalii TaxID=2055835 RepID=A0ABU2H616_9ACTN|nr:phosphoribosyltransferase [Lipingzhangella rawalii]MDS1270743.1 phosphoribosyltransferase [Lipingzhangella rawalii]